MIVIDERTGEVKKVNKKPHEYIREKANLRDLIKKKYKGKPMIFSSDGTIIIDDDKLTETKVKKDLGLSVPKAQGR